MPVGKPDLSVDTLIRIRWDAIPGAIGYRVYRSRTEDELGISITDFYIEGTDVIDVNVDANTTYWYTICAVLEEATDDTPEELGTPSAQVRIKTGETITGGNTSGLPTGTKKNILLMQIESPDMTVNNVKQIVDPVNGQPKEYRDPKTTPIIRNNRTFVPIRAIIEAMGGTVGWEDATRKITLNANGHKVEMWLDKKDLFVDGVSKEMDVALFAAFNRTMVPVRFAAENVGCAVEWINSDKTIVVVYFTDANGIGISM
jgi:hypothetical protein